LNGPNGKASVRNSLIHILLLYYDVNVVDVFPPTKSDAFVVKIGLVCG
jgi:hypothetical protein